MQGRRSVRPGLHLNSISSHDALGPKSELKVPSRTTSVRLLVTLCVCVRVRVQACAVCACTCACVSNKLNTPIYTQLLRAKIYNYKLYQENTNFIKMTSIRKVTSHSPLYIYILVLWTSDRGELICMIITME